MYKRKAISPLVATIILLAITVAGGLIIYGLFHGTSGVLSAKAQVSVDSAKLLKDTFVITIKNTGNKPVTKLTVTLNGTVEMNVTLPSGGLAPGMSVAHTKTWDSAQYNVGDVVPVVIEAKFEDGSTFTYAMNVVCEFA